MNSKLRNLVSHRKVLVLGTAPSLKELKKVSGIDNKNFCIIALNNLYACEDVVGKAIIEVFWCTARCRFDHVTCQIKDFLRRPYDKMFFTMDYWADKINIKEYTQPYIVEGYNSLFSLLVNLVRNDINDIFLFGFDGFVDGDHHYKSEQFFDWEIDYDYKKMIEQDTRMFNEAFWSFEDLRNNKRINIINVTDRSNIECFKKMEVNKFSELCIKL